MHLDPIRQFPVEEYLLTRMAFAPDAAALAVGHKRFRTYDGETGAPQTEFDFPDFLAQLGYSPDGSSIAAVNVGDNHPATRGRVALFDAATGEALWAHEAAAPVETCAFGADSLYWNGGGVIAGARLSDGSTLASIAVPDLQIRALAATPLGFVCFGREAVGSVKQVEGADLIFRKFRLISLDRAGKVKNNIDLGIGAGVHALSPDGKLLAVEMVDFKNNERHVSLIDVETGVEANLLSLEASTLPVLDFGLGSEYLLCMKEDAEANFNRLRIWRTSDLTLIGETRVELTFHSMATRLEHSTVAFIGGGQLAMYAVE